MKMMKILTQVLAVGSLGISALNAQQVWVVDSLQRVGQTDAPGTAFDITLYAAKGESESLQVIVRAPSSGLTITNLTASDLTGPGGATISQQNFTFYREYYVNVATPSGPNLGGTNLSMGPGSYPDPLIPFKDPSTGLVLNGSYKAVPYALAGNHNQPFWIDINVPRTAVAGHYSGTVTVTTSLGTFTVPITLQVWNFTLPVAPRLKASFGFGGNAFITAANNEVMLQNRVGSFIIPSNEVSALKPYGAEITGLPFFNAYSGCTIESPPSLSTLSAAVAQYAGFPTYVYPADEVNGCANLAQNLQLWAQVAHAAGTKTLVTVIPQAALLDDGTGTGHTDVDYWVILPKQYATALPDIPTVLAKGNEIWSYTAIVQDNYSPKWEIDFAPINYRIFPGFINQQFKFTGMLYSRVNRWTSNPWNNVNTFQISPYNYFGEEMLVYPGEEVGMSSTSIVPSLRLKFLRDGFDDYDYIALLKEQGDSAFADSIVNSIAPDWTNWTRSTATLLNARIELGNELDRLGGGSTQQVATPTFSPTGGTYSAAQTVTISTSTTGDSIRYTTDGSTPSSTVGTLYSSPVTVSSSMTVKAIGYMSGWTNSAVSSTSYTINPSTLQAPSNPWPTVGATAVATSLTLQCNAVTGATQYQFYLGTSSTAPPFIATVTATLNVVRQPALNLTQNTKYYWRVVAINGSTSASSPIWSFTTDSPLTLQLPTNPWPTNGSTGNTTSLTLQCNAVTGATQYQFYLGTSSTAPTYIATVTATGSVVRQPALNLTQNTKYYWKVVAINGSTSASSPIWSFTTDSPLTLQPPTNPWPTNGSTGNTTSLTLQCNAVTGATQYQIYLGTSSTALSLIKTTTATGSVVRQAVYNLSASKTYYWKVIATNGSTSASGPVWSFRTP